jgi:hypothetical protein
VSERCPSGAGFVGLKLPLPPGGDDFERATLVTPCFYTPQIDVPGDEKHYYKVSLRSGQALSIKMRLRGIGASNVFITLHGPDGAEIGNTGSYADSSMTPPLEYTPPEAGPAYFTLRGAVRGAALEISVR